MQADDIIAALDLKPHPEGGHFRETFRDGPVAGPFAALRPVAPGVDHRDGPVAGPFAALRPAAPGRDYSTAIYFLLKAGEASRWHRIDAAEVWHYYKGAPLELRIEGRAPILLGPDLAAGQAPQIVVPPGAWQAARSIGDFTLVGCTVAPGFDFAAFELAPDGFEPG